MPYSRFTSFPYTPGYLDEAIKTVTKSLDLYSKLKNKKSKTAKQSLDQVIFAIEYLLMLLNERNHEATKRVHEVVNSLEPNFAVAQGLWGDCQMALNKKTPLEEYRNRFVKCALYFELDAKLNPQDHAVMCAFTDLCTETNGLLFAAYADGCFKHLDSLVKDIELWAVTSPNLATSPPPRDLLECVCRSVLNTHPDKFTASSINGSYLAATALRILADEMMPAASTSGVSEPIDDPVPKPRKKSGSNRRRGRKAIQLTADHKRWYKAYKQRKTAVGKVDLRALAGEFGDSYSALKSVIKRLTERDRVAAQKNTSSLT